MEPKSSCAVARSPSTEPEDCCLHSRCQSHSLFADLDSTAVMDLDRRRQATIYPAGATVYLQDDPCRMVCCVAAGRVKLVRSAPDGRVIVLGVATSGDLLGVRPALLGVPHDHTADTMEDTRLCFIPTDLFTNVLARSRGTSLALARRLCTELDDAYRHVCDVLLKSTAERVAELIFTLCRTRGEPGPGGIKLDAMMCQQELAEFLGVSRRSLSRALAVLRRRGLIESHRGFIVVRDWSGLTRVSASPERHARPRAATPRTPPAPSAPHGAARGDSWP